MLRAHHVSHATLFILYSLFPYHYKYPLLKEEDPKITLIEIMELEITC